MQPEGAGISLSDVYHVCFRHKWMILVFALAGLVAAGFLYSRKAGYRSWAKLVVRQVVDRKAITPVGEGDQVRQPDFSGASIMSTETEILSSWDLAVKVAEQVGPDEILNHPKGPPLSNSPDDLERAARVVQQGLHADVPSRANIIAISFTHADPGVVTNVLTRLIEEYLNKHVEIHRGVASFSMVSNQTVEARLKLQETEAELRRLKSQAGVISLEESRKDLASEVSAVRQSLLEAEAALAERKAAASLAAPGGGTATQPGENANLTGQSADELALYRSVCAQLTYLRSRELELLGRFTEQSPLVTGTREQIAAWERRKKEMESANPALASLETMVPADRRGSNELINAAIPATALEAKVSVLKEQLKKLKAEVAELDGAEDAIVRLQRTRLIQENNYRYFSERLEQARIDTELDASKLSSIGVVQAPSPPVRDRSAFRKRAVMALAGGVVGGLALAFLLEFFLDPTVKRPVEIESRLHLPLLMTIPQSARHDNGSRPGRRKPRKRTTGPGTGAQSPGEGRPAEVALWDPQHALRPYYEALRDRILMQFENVARRPKLVGLTSCSTGSGVTTLATGLAAAMSESGQGKVLLVDLNGDNGSLHPFSRGQPACALAEALENGASDPAAVHGNLVLASTTPHPLLSRTLLEAIPKLKASDYDYVIFDLPPISQTSITLRLASYMDEVMLVAEAQKTHKGLLQKAYTLLTQSQANVRTILNKHRSYVPSFLQQEL